MKSLKYVVICSIFAICIGFMEGKDKVSAIAVCLLIMLGIIAQNIEELKDEIKKGREE